jgi:hypothetical protein
MPIQARILLRPVYAARRVAYKVYELTHPHEPWISQKAVRWLESELRPSMVGLEWGSGRSTAWFAQRIERLTSIEHNPLWFERVRSQIGKLPNVDYRLVPLDHPEHEPTRPRYDPQPRYVAVVEAFPDVSLDLVVIDGHYRQACVAAVLPKIRPGGLLVIDNTNWLPEREWGVPSHFPLLHRSENVMTQTSIWQAR